MDDDPRSAGETARLRKTVRSFVRREGRLTRGQQRALNELWPQFGIENGAEPLDLQLVFGRGAPRVMEIGFGNGDALATMAAAQPDVDFVGVEVHRPGVGHLLLAIERLGLRNVRIVCADAVEFLRQRITDASLARVHIFFPDPWPKKRHHKRRLIQSGFVELLARKIERGGALHLATDWEPYAEHMLAVLGGSRHFDNQARGKDLATGCVPRPDARPVTKFERRGHRHGHGVWDIAFTRNNE